MIKRAIILASFCPQAMGQLSFNDAQFSELSTSARALGLGNALIAKAYDTDSASIFYNPAGLGSFRGLRFRLSNLQFEWNTNGMDLGDGDENFFSSIGNFRKAFSLEGLRGLQTDTFYRPTFGRVNATPHFTVRHFSLGYLYSLQTKTQAKQEEGEDFFEYADRTDHGPYAALNFPLFGGAFKAGVLAVLLERKEAYGQAPLHETLPPIDYRRGTGLFFVAGGKFTFPTALLPTLALKVNNAAGGSFRAEDGRVAPERIQTSFDLGFSLSPKFGPRSQIHLEVDFRDALGAHENVSFGRKFAMGLELDFVRTFFLRFGLSEGFGSLGVGARTRFLSFHLASYAVDLSDDQFRGSEGRRFALSFSYGL